jgi:hypothetical protein
MTRRSGLAHARAELQAKVKTWMAGALFTQQDTWLSRRIKKTLGADRPAENNDPELRHDDYESKR